MTALPHSCETLLDRLVRVNSVNPRCGGPVGGEAALAAEIEALAGAWGLATRRMPVGASGAFNLLVYAPGPAEGGWLLLESHLDTVSIEGMTVEPFAVTDAGDRLYGRGTCDTKGSGAAMLWALRAYASDGPRPRSAGVVFTVDEEAGMAGAQALARGLAAFPGLRGIVVGEPTELAPVVAHNGAFRWRSITRGVAAHSADPSKGRSAIRAMVPVIEALERDFIPKATRVFPLTGRAAASINLIRGGTAENIIPDYCEITCDRRMVPGETPAEVMRQRDEALAGLPVENDSEYLAPPLSPENSGELLAWVRPALEAEGLDPTPRGKLYATNASHYAAAGAPVLVLGPGDMAQAHRRDEWVARDQLTRAAALYRSILAR